MTELNYLDSVRVHSLKVFETLIFCLGDQQKDQAMPELEGLDSEKKESTLDPPASLCSQQIVSVPPSLSKFYAGLKGAYPKKKKSISQDVHVNTINLFLCVAFLCVSKEADSDRDSANDSEDTSGYDSTASEPLSHKLPCLSLESLVLPSPEHIHRAADIWAMCRWIYLYSSVFQRQFHRLGGFEVCHKLLIMIIQKLSKNKEKQQEKKEGLFTENGKNVNGSPRIEPVFKEALSHVTKKNKLASSEVHSLVENSEATRPLVSEHISNDHSFSVEQISGTPVHPELDASERRENEWAFQSIRLLEALLTICLHSVNNMQQKLEMETLHQVINPFFEVHFKGRNAK